MEPEDLLPEQVLGHKLLEIRQVSACNDGLDWTTSYFILDSGASFVLPTEFGNGLCNEAAPNNAMQLSSATAIIGQKIVALLRPTRDLEYPNEALYLKFANGYFATDIMGAYSGTNSTGIYLFPPGEIDPDLLEPLWEEIVPR